MHNAKVETSSRLRKMLIMLERGRTYNTFELQKATNDMSPATTISELRKNGYNIKCCYQRRTAAGRKIYNYELL